MIRPSVVTPVAQNNPIAEQSGRSWAFNAAAIRIARLTESPRSPLARPAALTACATASRSARAAVTGTGPAVAVPGPGVAAAGATGAPGAGAATGAAGAGVGGGPSGTPGPGAPPLGGAVPNGAPITPAGTGPAVAAGATPAALVGPAPPVTAPVGGAVNALPPGELVACTVAPVGAASGGGAIFGPPCPAPEPCPDCGDSAPPEGDAPPDPVLAGELPAVD